MRRFAKHVGSGCGNNQLEGEGLESYSHPLAHLAHEDDAEVKFDPASLLLALHDLLALT